jgi:polysaccharide export outer membrane protein
MKPGIASMGCALILALGLSGTWATRAFAQDYQLGPEDVVTVSVYLHPELERTATVSAQGNITFPPLGEVKAAGSTAKELGDRIADKLSSYLRQTSAVTVAVSKYMSRSVYVSGAVAVPGRYGFEKIPGLIDVIGQAGGALPGADLTRVEVVRREGEARRSLYADVGSALRDGSKVALPELRAGDTVVVPMGAFGPAGLPGGGVGVLGQVAKPGLYPVGGSQDIWQVLAMSGGLTPQGDLSGVRVITTDGGRQAVVTVNLRDMLNRGGRNPYLVKSGDVVYVGTSGAANFGRAWTGMTSVLLVARDIVDLVVIKRLLEENP